MGERTPNEPSMVAKTEEGIQRQSDPSDPRLFSRCIFWSEAVGRGRRDQESECLCQADQAAGARALIPKARSRTSDLVFAFRTTALVRRRRDTNVSGEDPLPPGGALLASIPVITVFDGPLTLASHLVFPNQRRPNVLHWT